MGISHNAIDKLDKIFKMKNEDRSHSEKEVIYKFLKKCVDFFKECQREVINTLIEKFEPVEYEAGQVSKY